MLEDVENVKKKYVPFIKLQFANFRIFNAIMAWAG